MGIKLKNIPLTLAEFKKNYQALRTKLEQIEYLTVHKLNFQKELKENKKNEGNNNALLQVMINFAENEIKNLGGPNSPIGILIPPDSEKLALIETMEEKYKERWKKALESQQELIKSNELLNKEKIDHDPEESNLIKRGAAGEIDNDFEASAYYSLTQKAPIGWEIKWSKTGKSFSLNKAQVPEKTKNFLDNWWILPVFLLLIYLFWLSYHYAQKNRIETSTRDPIDKSQKIVLEKEQKKLKTKTSTVRPSTTLERSKSAQVIENEKTSSILRINGKFSLNVVSEPPFKKVRILNIIPEFKQGIKLDPGMYQLEVKSPSNKIIKYRKKITDRDVTTHVFFRITENYPSGEIYVGTIVDGNRHGQGTYTWPSGDKYVGEFKDGNRHGQGTYTLPSGDKYVGEFKDGKENGPGKFIWASGDKGVGEFREGNPWNFKVYDNKGKIIREFVNGIKKEIEEIIEQVLYFSKVSGQRRWYKNGDEKKDAKYVGKIENGKPNGQGTLTFPDGERYQGKWKDGMYHGQGTYTWSDGRKYVGEYKDGKKHGNGTYTSANGNKYQGEWKNGNFNGQGTYTWPSGEKFVGKFKDGKKHGQGTYTLPNGKKYEGEWKYGNEHGNMTYTFPNGDKYQGEWKDGKKHGNGTYTSANGNKYQGEWENGRENGQGTYTWPSGEKFVGEWKNGRENGQGTYTHLDGRKYEGQWKNGRENGQGTYTWSDGDKYQGEWKNGRRNGKGTLTWTPGNKYVGEWKDGKMNGQGTYIWPSGDKYVGEYKNNKHHGQGIYTSSNGGKYVGEYKDGKKHGKGIDTFPDGSEYEGEFKNHKRWNVIWFDKEGYVKGTYTNGVLKYKNNGKVAGREDKGNLKLEKISTNISKELSELKKLSLEDLEALEQTIPESAKNKTISLGFFQLGSTTDELTSVMGSPANITEKYGIRTWFYGKSTVKTQSGKVSGWEDNGNLKLKKMSTKLGNEGGFTIGSTTDELTSIMGSPANITEKYGIRTWFYGKSTVKTQSGKVSGWGDNGNLKLKKMSTELGNEGGFTIGSTTDELTSVMGSPANITEKYGIRTWFYGKSTVKTQSGKVSGWGDNGNLKLKKMSTKLGNEGGFTIGSTTDELTSIMGSPANITEKYGIRTWFYGKSTVKTQSGKVSGWEDNGNLKLKKMSTKLGNEGGFTIGSTTDELTSVMGSPANITEKYGIRTWFYGKSTVKTQSGKVSGWEDKGNLKLR